MEVADYKLMPNGNIVEPKSGMTIGQLNLDGSITQTHQIVTLSYNFESEEK